MRRFVVLLAALLCGAVLPVLAAQPAAGISGVAPIKGNQCVECHETEATTSHSFHSQCNACHTNAVEHLQSHEAREKAKGPNKPPKIVAIKPDSKECLSCHKNDSKRMNFAFSDHHKAGVQCRDCHGNHTPKIKSLTAGMTKAGKEAALCASCHKDVMAKFNMRSHHPLREGGVTCVSCHDQHGGKQTTLAGKTTQCTQCHQNVRGPHAFDHAPVVEDCMTCHNAHGTPNRKLLALAEPALCLQCHSVAGNRHGQPTGTSNPTGNGLVISATALRNCSSCHNAIHGSGSDQHLRF